MSPAAEITITHHGIQTTGWNAVLKVAAVLSPTSVRVELDEYSEADLDWWAQTYAVACTPVGDHDNATVTTISSIAGGGVLNFPVAHNLYAGDFIIPAAVNALQTALARYDADQFIA